jgi:hypothetical protein
MSRLQHKTVQTTVYYRRGNPKQRKEKAEGPKTAANLIDDCRGGGLEAGTVERGECLEIPHCHPKQYILFTVLAGTEPDKQLQGVRMPQNIQQRGSAPTVQCCYLRLVVAA